MKAIHPILLVNLASLMISTSGVIGRVIDMPSAVASFYRSVFALVFLIIISVLINQSIKVNFSKHWKPYVLSGFFLGMHWASYFYAIQLSNVSIAVIAIFTYPIITTILEPIVSSARLKGLNLVTSLIVVFGVFVLVPEFDLNNDHTSGLVVGLISALFFASRNIVSKQLVGVRSGSQVMIVQLGIAAIVLLPSLFIYSYEMTVKSWGLLIALGLITTAIGHTILILALRELAASTVGVLASLQPVYAILLAVLLIGEKLTQNVILGGLMILTAVVIQSGYPYLKRKTNF